MLHTPTKIVRLFITGLIFLVCAFDVRLGSAKAQSEIAELALRQAVEKSMTTGDTHTLRVRLNAGDYLRVVIDQTGIDILITVLDPSDQKVVEVDSPVGAYGPEYVSFIAEKSGDHFLKLRTATGRTNTGRYSARIETLRTATAEDKESAAAEKAFFEGRRLLAQSQSTAEPEPHKRRAEALEKFKNVRSYWAKHKLVRWEAMALHSLGVTHRRMSQLKEAADYFREALKLAPQLERRDWRLTATFWNDSGLNYTALAEHSLAKDALTQALKVFRENRDRRGEGSALINIGISLYWANNFREGLSYFEQALPLRQEEKDRASEANILNSIGDGYKRLGEPHRALKEFSKSLEIFNDLDPNEKERNGRLLGAVFNNLALVYHMLGDWQPAIYNYEQALKIFRKLDAVFAARTQNNLGNLYSEFGNSERALKELNAAFELSSKSGDPTTQAEILINIGQVKASQGETVEALAYFIKAQSLKANDGVRASALTSIANIKILQGEPRAALASLEEALAIQRKIENREGEAFTLQRRGEAFLKLGLKKEALEDFKLALAHSNAIAAPQSKIDALYGIARVERDAGDLGSAVTHSKEAIDLIESQRTKVPGQQLRTSYFSTQLSQYELYIDLMMRQYRATQSHALLAAALEVSERSRARNLRDLLNEANVDLRRGVDERLLQQEREAQQKLNAKARAQTEVLNRKHSKDEATNIAREVAEAIAEYDAVKEKIRASSPEYAQLTQPQSLRLSEIQQLLDDETVLLQYFLGNERSYLWLVSRNGIRPVDSLPNRATIESSAEAFYNLLTDQTSSLNATRSSTRSKKLSVPSPPGDAAALSQMLLGPIANDISNKRLLIVSDGVLQYLPFGALPVPGQQSVSGQASFQPRRSAKTPYLIEEHEIVYLPSASTLAVLRSEASSREPRALSLAVLANPVFGADDERLKTAKQGPSSIGVVSVDKPSAPNLSASRVQRSGLSPLPATEKEADDIKSVFHAYGRTETFKGFDASRDRVLKLQDEGFRIVHFATHGIVDSEHPELSGIVLSEFDSNGKPQDGFLRLHQIYNLKLPADLIVLSACSTGLGQIIKGEGLIGLTRGFMHAGSPRVIASLWRVEDLGTSELMKRFYQHLAKEGMAPTAALRQAQIEMIRHKRWNSPYHWAGFVLQGEWRPIR